MLKMAGPHVVQIANMIEECDGMQKIEELQNHENVDIYKLAYDIIEQFFSDEVRDDPPSFILSVVSYNNFPLIVNSICHFAGRRIEFGANS